ncbi:MAG: FAD-dependent oxidoreductase, partial [Bacteroidetes bacterium]|nr:FAD-dependent oxidoreductase [Bacteroidota bacterium]
AVTGLGKDFYRRIGAYYGKFEQWTFEPYVADKVFADYIREANLDIRKNTRLTGVRKEGERLASITVENAQAQVQTIRARMFIDCTYEGDLMAAAGVSYTVGRESSSQYGERYNGVQLSDYHQFPDGIDPYKVPGNPASGLLWGISNEKLAPTGTGDKKIQAYNFRLCLTQDKNNFIPVTKPDSYDPQKYELLLRVMEAEKWKTIHNGLRHEKLPDGTTRIHHQGGFLIKNMPNGKTDFNNFGGFSTDMIGMNYDYPEADYATRKKIWQDHEDYTKGLLYFLGHDARVPAHLRQEMQSWGYAKDEFTDLGGFSNQLYVREARRMVGETVMTQKHCEGQEIVADAIGMAAYQMDSHNCQRVVVNGMVKNEGDVEKSVPAPYPISYGAITPKRTECNNLLVPVCLSASHIAYGSIRMEPVFMVLGQVAATAAAMAIDKKSAVQEIDVKALQQRLEMNPLGDGSLPEVVVDNDDLSPKDLHGNWARKNGGYGRSLLVYNSGQGEEASARFTPEISRAGAYEIYAYFPRNENLSTKIVFTVHDGKHAREVVLKPSEIKEIGLSSGEWASLGTYRLPAGNQSYVSVSTKGADGEVLADALIWKPVSR